MYNAESPRRYVYGMSFPRKEGTVRKYTYHEDVTGCHLFFRQVKRCEVLKPESQTLVNVFSIYNAHILAHPWAFCGNVQGKYTEK